MSKKTPFDPMSRAEEALFLLVRELVDCPDAVLIVRTDTSGTMTVLTVRVARYDMGKVLGRKGSKIDAIRILWEGIAAKYGRSIKIEVPEPGVD